MQEFKNITHTFEPVFNENSKILILGTFPSVKSRENHFYYGHPQNRFWKVMAAVMDSTQPQTIEEKKNFLLENHIAVWDVIHSCSIEGSSDSSITDVVPNDFTEIFARTHLLAVAANGTKAYELYQKYVYPVTKREIIKMPSTSPANAAWNLARLTAAYRELFEKSVMADEKPPLRISHRPFETDCLETGININFLMKFIGNYCAEFPANSQIINIGTKNIITKQRF